jgi:hypothetical protein
VYQAKLDYQLGIDIRKKIFPHILSSVGLVALWTSKAAEKPDWVLREIKYAKRNGKLVALLVEPMVEPPTGWPKYIERFPLNEFGSGMTFGQTSMHVQIRNVTRTIRALRAFYANGTLAEMRRTNPITKQVRVIRRTLEGKVQPP